MQLASRRHTHQLGWDGHLPLGAGHCVKLHSRVVLCARRILVPAERTDTQCPTISGVTLDPSNSIVHLGAPAYTGAEDLSPNYLQWCAAPRRRS